jgi:autotransporter-associated beta strand protein
LTTAILLFTSSFASAADNSWNVASGDWSDTSPCPWSLGVEPTSSDTAYITNGGTATISQSDETCKFLRIGGANTGTVEMNGGSLTARETVGDTGTGTFIQTAGTNTTPDLYLGRHTSGKGVYQLSGSGQLIASDGELMGNGGTGSFIQTGGINKCRYLLFGDGSYYGATNASGSYDLSGTGQVIVEEIEEIGIYGSGTFNHSGGTNSAFLLYLGKYQGFSGSYNLTAIGQLNVSLYEAIGYDGNGVFTQSGGINNANWLRLGLNSTASGTYNLSDTGVLNADETIGDEGNGVFTQSGGINNASGLELGSNSTASGTYNLSDTGALNAPQEDIGGQGSGTFNQSGGTNKVSLLVFAGTNGTYNLNGGTLITSSITKYSGNASFNFGGGTLQASGNLSISLPMTLTGINGNANIDTAGYAVTLSGVLSGDGGLNKLGSGTLTLSASNTYGGNTNISAGTLTLSRTGTIGSSAIIDVLSGGILDTSAKNSYGGFSLNSMQILQGNGNVIGNIVATQGSHIAPGDSTGVLTIAGNLTLNSGALLNFDLDSTSASDKIAMTGSTLFLNTQQFSDFTFNPLNDFGIGTYVLIDAGSIQGSLGTNFSGTIGGLPASLSTLGNDLVLTVVPEPATIGLLATGFLCILAGILYKQKRHLPGFYT